MTPLDLEAIEKRAKDAPLPDWVVPEYDKAKPRHKILAQVELIEMFGVQVVPFTVGDVPLADFIANARQDIPALLAEVARLQGENAAFKAEVCKCGHLKSQHRFHEDHHECFDCIEQTSDEDEQCGWFEPDVPKSESVITAMRERLERVTVALKQISYEAATEPYALKQNKIIGIAQGALMDTVPANESGDVK